MNDTRLSRGSVTCQLDIQDWYGRVYALCQANLTSAADAEDATQETFVRAFSRIDDLRSPSALGGWLRQIAKNVCIDMIRRAKIRRTTPDDVELVPSRNSQENATAERENRDRIVDQVHALPEPLREIILLHYYDNMTYDQMATWLDVARSTVNERLSKARQLLKQRLTMENAP